jgi:HAD superfamily hydrolase (TIGR01549 family)
MKRLRAVLFDWDGTLVDSAEATYRCYEEVFGAFGIAFGRARFASTYSPNWLETYRQVGLPEADWPRADRLWLEAYGRRRSVLLPGAHSALARLRAADLVLGLVTSGDRGRVSEELRELGVQPFFGALVCGGDLPFRKPRPEPLLAALRELEVEAAAAAYVGDSPEDVLMTRAAGAFAVAVPGGFPNHAALAASGPDAHAANLEEAVQLLLDRLGPGASREAIRSS